MSANTVELVKDELDLMRRLLPLAGARVADLGCGAADMARRLVEGGLVASVSALEVDQVQHAKNLAGPRPAGLEFFLAGADAIPFRDANFDIALMFKSLHHVPVERLNAALAEIRRVLVPGGLLYVSEPVFAGPFNEIVRLFHDEEAVRAAALAALRRAAASGALEQVEERQFDVPLAFRDFDDFFDRIVRVTHSDHTLVGERLAEVRRRFEGHMGPGGARFVRPMRVNLMRRPV
ncbi:MAG TPA: class I SAM-dependent methyltransferase [Usitatibacteraceae bacterium]|nr:class I SAM-dependent methyltransferase [Usitatibacteraceae bacterium]